MSNCEIAKPLSDADIREFLDHPMILKYSDLANYPTLHDVLPEVGSYCFLLYESSLNNGHWTVILRPEEGIVEYFDSYGGYVDDPLRWTDNSTQVGLGVSKPYLSILLRKTPEEVIYNKTKFQKDGPNINDCGRWCILRVVTMMYGLNLKDFKEFVEERVKKNKISPDQLVTDIIHQ